MWPECPAPVDSDCAGLCVEQVRFSSTEAMRPNEPEAGRSISLPRHGSYANTHSRGLNLA